jgi:hypothetical protein
MVENNKENVQYVISHLEGCSGNFLGFLIADVVPKNTNIFRVDTGPNDLVLSLNGRYHWHKEIQARIKNHTVVVTHNFDTELINTTFPNAKIIQLYPYTHIGNVLYNISYKKLTLKLSNLVDNHFIDIANWHKKIQSFTPSQTCYNYWNLTDVNFLKDIISKELTDSQKLFFNNYWATQLNYNLNMPSDKMSMPDLIKFWGIEDNFSPWMVAWLIYVFEYLHELPEEKRLWSINDAINFCSWADVTRLERMYRV